MHDPDVRDSFEGFAPPVPTGFVAGSVSEGLEVGHGFPVGDCEDAVTGAVIDCHEGGRFAEIWRLHGLELLEMWWVMGGTYNLS